MTPPSPDELLALDNQVCFALHAASRSVVRAYRSALSGLDLTYAQYLVMLVLWEWESRPPPAASVHALGVRLDLDSGTLTPLLRRLEQKGLITRRRASHDERVLEVGLTARGRTMKFEAAKVPLSLLACTPLPLDELLALREQLKRLRHVLIEREHLARAANE